MPQHIHTTAEIDNKSGEELGLYRVGILRVE